MPLFFFFNKNWRERPTHIVEHLFCGMSGWYNANFSKKYSKGVYGMHVNLDHECMKRILPRVTTVWQSSMQKQAAYVCMVFRKYHHMALVAFWHIKEELHKGFSKFSNKFPKHLNNKERRSYHPNHISNINYLDKHVFLKNFIHKQQGDKHGINICKPTIGNM